MNQIVLMGRIQRIRGLFDPVKRLKARQWSILFDIPVEGLATDILEENVVQSGNFSGAIDMQNCRMIDFGQIPGLFKDSARGGGLYPSWDNHLEG
jgi:hypothetical protein